MVTVLASLAWFAELNSLVSVPVASLSYPTADELLTEAMLWTPTAALLLPLAVLPTPNALARWLLAMLALPNALALEPLLVLPWPNAVPLRASLKVPTAALFWATRSEEHTSELQYLMPTSYA